MKKLIVSAVLLGLAVVCLLFFYTSGPGTAAGNKADEAKWEAAQQADTADAYIELLASLPTGEGYNRNVYRARTALGKLAMEAVNGGCSMEEISIYAPDLIGKFSLANHLAATATPVGITLTESTEPGSPNELTVTFTTTVLRETYVDPNVSGVFYTRKAGRSIDGTASFKNGEPVPLSREYTPQSIRQLAENDLEQDSLETVFKMSFRDVFIELMKRECNPASIAAFYLDFRDPELKRQQGHLYFSPNEETDAFLLEHIDEVIPVLISVTHSNYSSTFAQDHVAKLLLQTEEPERLARVTALLHGSYTSVGNGFDALVEMDTAESMEVLLTQGVTLHRWGVTGLEGAFGSSDEAKDYFKAKAGPEIAEIITAQSHSYSDAVLASLLKWTLNDSSVPVYAKSDDRRILNAVASAQIE